MDRPFGRERELRIRTVPSGFRLPGASWLILAALSSPEIVLAETVYAVSTNGGYNDGFNLVHFDSASPSSLERSIPVTGALEYTSQATLEFDPETRELYGFAYENCPILCPPFPRPAARIDPFTGNSVEMGWPEFPVAYADYDIDPVTRELRLIGFYGRNFRLSLGSLEPIEDTPLDTSGTYAALAHTYATEGGAGVETFAIAYTEFGLQLARIGGPGGLPPASSGDVTLIGPLNLQGAFFGFDISRHGTAYVSTADWFPDLGIGGGYVNRLYTIDLSNASVQEIGIIATPGPASAITGIAVAPTGLGSSILEVPTLSSAGRIVLAIVIAVSASRVLSCRRRDRLGRLRTRSGQR